MAALSLASAHCCVEEEGKLTLIIASKFDGQWHGFMAVVLLSLYTSMELFYIILSQRQHCLSLSVGAEEEGALSLFMASTSD